MRRSPAVIIVLLLFSMISISAEQTLFFRSNSIGQRLDKLYEIDLYDPEIRQGYVLTVTEEEGGTTRELKHDDRIIWTETIKTPESRRMIERVDANGMLIFSQQYNQGLLQQEAYRLAGSNTRYQLTYGQDRHLMMTTIEADDTSQKSYFLEPSGQLRGLIHEATDEQDSYSLLFDAETFALGHEQRFTITYADEQRTIIARYEDGSRVQQEASYTDDKGRQVEEVTDYLKKSLVRKRYDADEKLIMEEIYSPLTTLKRGVEYSYDQQGRVDQKIVTTQHEILQHIYSYEDEVKTETIWSGDQMVKIIRYLENRQEHTLFIDDEFYAKVIYAQDGTIEGITYE
jgi:hypothetical protein